MVDTIPMFGGTLADVGQVVQKLEKQFNRGQAHKAKGAWATQKKFICRSQKPLIFSV